MARDREHARGRAWVAACKGSADGSRDLRAALGTSHDLSNVSPRTAPLPLVHCRPGGTGVTIAALQPRCVPVVVISVSEQDLKTKPAWQLSPGQYQARAEIGRAHV